MERAEVLEAAKGMVSGQRQEDYGSPERNFEVISDLWSVYLKHMRFKGITSRDVAAMMILLKVGRRCGGKPNIDNWIDAAGYAACGGELEFDDSRGEAD